MIVYIKITTIGAAAGPFDLYSDLDPVTPFATNVDKNILLTGKYYTIADGTTSVTMASTGSCTNSLVVGITQPTTTTTSTTEIPFTVIEYGALYNWYAATDNRKITSSDDWVVPQSSDLETLALYIGELSEVFEGYTEYTNGGKLKETGTVRWETPNTGATNEYLFNAVGSGVRDDEGFGALLQAFVIWSRTINVGIDGTANTLILYYDSDILEVGNDYYNKAKSIRLLYTGAGTPTEYVGNDGKVYPVVVIGGQRWINCNLNETKFRNGDWINGYNSGVYTPISNAAWAALTTEAMCYYNDDENNG